MNAPRLLVAPSILSADCGRLAEEVRAVDEAGADLIHVDIMDGRFVPNITFGPGICAAVRKATRKPVNVHLMIVEPERFIGEFANAGADQILVQAEPTSTIHLHRVLAGIRSLGKMAGVALNPATPLSDIEYVLHLCGMVNVMTVNPGFGGQSFLSEMLPKIGGLRAMCRDRGVSPHIMLDGGINLETIGSGLTAGADVFVAGSYVFDKPDYAEAIRKLRAAGDVVA